METQMIQEIELKYTATKRTTQNRIITAQQSYDTFMKLWNQDTIELYEEFKILYMNRYNHIIGVYNHSKGGISGTVADVRLIIGMALKCAASAIILAHNHPSGNKNPSEVDIQLTRKIKECCETFDIILLDHIVLTSDDFYSFKENGLL
jgi:DNA repair protein RadC